MSGGGEPLVGYRALPWPLTKTSIPGDVQPAGFTAIARYMRKPRACAVKPLTFTEPVQYVPSRCPTPAGEAKVGPGLGHATPAATYGSRKYPAVVVTLGWPVSCCQ